MRTETPRSWPSTELLIAFCVLMGSAIASAEGSSISLDARVQQFLENKRSEWHDWNIPYQDGRVLHDLTVRNKHTRALEIGTSSGHSTTWIAWALSKTGGKLITIEIDEGLRRKALQNFRAVGLQPFIDARRADAHELVRELQGPFDFVFLDADKEWYTQYFKDLETKLAKGGCFAAHNVSNAFPGMREFLDHIRNRPDYRTSIDRSSSSGISISCKHE